MIEFPEAQALAAQLNRYITGKTVERVYPPTKPHKFCWFNGEPTDYDVKLRGAKAAKAEGFGIYVEQCFDNGCKLCVNDGVNLRLVKAGEAPKAYQLLIVFTDGDALAFTVAMYGGIVLHEGDYDNEYYLKSRAYISPLSPAFPAHFTTIWQSSKQTLSAKAFLAAEQRFPGIGNGVLQDILFAARIHPKRKLQTMGEAERERLLQCTVSVLKEMKERGGRDTEKSLLGEPGGYVTKLSKNTLAQGCPVCHAPIVKEAYMGGAVYYCPACQK